MPTVRVTYNRFFRAEGRIVDEFLIFAGRRSFGTATHHKGYYTFRGFRGSRAGLILYIDKTLTEEIDE